MHNFYGLLLFVIFGMLALFFARYFRNVKNLKASLVQVSKSFQELDAQAKLILQTDLELNKTQEALDKRLNGLDALHKISRLISTTLIEDEIFHRLNQPFLIELGFEKFLILTFQNNGPFTVRVDFGFPRNEVAPLGKTFNSKPQILQPVKQGKIISSLSAPKDIKDIFTGILSVRQFIATPILSQKNVLGIILAGNQSESYTMTEGDEEVIAILADQIGHSLANARLFEQVFRSSQELERKVQDRTKELTSALEEVKRISKTKSDFISAVSHELRTPLTSIKGYASILITGKVGAVPDKVRERLEKINKHTDNLVGLINNLLDISRIESGRVEMKFLEHDIPSIIANVQDLLTPQLRDKNIQFTAAFDDALPNVFMDAGQIERVFINLINNAIKFTPISGTITAKVTHDSRKVTVGIADTGIGIKEEDIKKLFTEFYRVENEINQNVKGTGLGLALVKKIVEAHGGQIWVTSTVSVGTCFYFTLPTGPKTSTPGA
jgi:signal transduction histidine kinase